MTIETIENILSCLILIFGILGVGPFLIVPLILFTSIFCMVRLGEIIEKNQIDLHNVNWPRE